MSLDLQKLISGFLANAENDSAFELYNEAGLQYELAIYLRDSIPKTYRIQLERSVYDVFDNPNNIKFIKKEMDIFIYRKDHKEQYCIELKFPTKGAYPRRMYQTLEDVKFLEELKNKAHFTQVALLFITNQKRFRMTKKNNNPRIYRLFRTEYCIEELKNNEVPLFIRDVKGFKPLDIKGKYKFQWKTYRSLYHYFIINI